MGYCTLEDLYQDKDQEFIKLVATDEGDAGSEWVNRAEAQIEKATERINGYIGSRYAVPPDPVPGILSDLCVDIAIYFLLTRKGLDENSPDKSIKDRYKDAIDYLKDISTGKAQLGIGTGEEGESTPPTGVRYSFPDSRFNTGGFRKA